MVEKKKPKFTVPAPLVAEFDKLVGPLGGKAHWPMAAAAFLLLLEANEDVRNYYYQQSVQADGPGGSFEKLILRAKSGELRIEASGAATEAMRNATGSRNSPGLERLISGSHVSGSNRGGTRPRAGGR